MNKGRVFILYRWHFRAWLSNKHFLQSIKNSRLTSAHSIALINKNTLNSILAVLSWDVTHIFMFIFLPEGFSQNCELLSHLTFLLKSEYIPETPGRTATPTLFCFFFFLIFSLRSGVICLIFCSDTKRVPQESSQTGAKRLHFKQPQGGFLFFFVSPYLNFSYIFINSRDNREPSGGCFHTNFLFSRLTDNSLLLKKPNKKKPNQKSEMCHTTPNLGLKI